MMSGKLNGLDIGCIAIYFALVVGTGIFTMFRSNRGTISGYFLAGRFMTWLPALIILQLLGWVFLPVYIASGVHTLPEYMCRRFGGNRIRVYLALLSLTLYIFTKISVNMYSGALFVQVALGWNIYYAVLFVLAMTTICTVTGGLAAVIYTDTLQCFLMITGATGLSIYSFIEVGGYSGLVDKYMTAIPKNHDYSVWNSTCGLPSKEAFTMLRNPTDGDYPWPGFLLGQSPASIWYWAADQMMVQRVLASRSLSHAQGATIFAGYLKILPLFLIVMPGMISRVLYPDEVGCITDCYEICGNPISCSNIAYPKLVIELLPQGARGVMIAVMMAALMTDLTSIFNSSSTLFTIDIWNRIRSKASAKELLIVGRIFVMVMVLISILWVPIVNMQQGGQLYIYIQAIAADLSPPIAAVYLLAILWKRTNEAGAFWGLAVGFVVGVCRMILEFIYMAPGCGEPDTRPWIVAKLHYMYFAMLLFWITIIVTVMISLITPPPEKYRLIRTTFWTRKDRTRRGDDIIPEVDMEEEILAKEGGTTELDPMLIDGSEDSICGDKQNLGINNARHTRGPVWKSMVSGYNWFCGYDYSPAGQIKLAEFEAHLQNITTLEQTKSEKWILNTNLICIIIVAVVLFTVFSVVTPIK